MKFLGVLAVVLGFLSYSCGRDLIYPEITLLKKIEKSTPVVKTQNRVLKFEFWPDKEIFQMYEEDKFGNWKFLEVRNEEPEQLRLVGHTDSDGYSTLTGFEEEPFLWEDEAIIKCNIAEMIEKSEEHISGIFLVSNKCVALIDRSE